MQKNTRYWSLIIALLLVATVFASCAPAPQPAPEPTAASQEPAAAAEAAPTETVAPAQEPTAAAETLPAETAAPTQAPAAAEPAPESQPAPETKDYPALRIVTSFSIKNLDPIANSFWLSEFGAAELPMRLGEDFVLRPWVLESLEQIDDLNWRLTLRPGITFQNGKPLDAKALAALMERQLKLSSSAQAYLPDATVAVTGDLEVVLTTAQPMPSVPAALATEGIFPIYDAEVAEAAGEDYNKIAGAGMYTAPYEIVSLDEKALVLKRYESYWQGQPALPGVSVSFVADEQARVLAVQNDEADIALYPPIEAYTILQGRDDAYFVTAPVGRSSLTMSMNPQLAPFDEVEVRQAVGYAIDYESLANEVMKGGYTVSRGMFSSVVPFGLDNQRTDAEKARQLLDAAGWQTGANGVREKDGKPLKMTLLIYPQQPDLVPISTAIQAQLAEVGISVEIQSLDSLSQVLLGNETPWHAALLWNSLISLGGMPDPVLRRYLTPAGDRNYGKYDDPELTGMVDRLNNTFDEATRTSLLADIQKTVIEKHAWNFYPIVKLPMAVVSPAYKGYVPSMNLIHVLYDTRPTD